jgi:hypothetical protein
VLRKVVLRRILDLQERESNRRTEVVLKRIFGCTRKAVTGE